jgi:hypothetical protein
MCGAQQAHRAGLSQLLIEGFQNRDAPASGWLAYHQVGKSEALTLVGVDDCRHIVGRLDLSFTCGHQTQRRGIYFMPCVFVGTLERPDEFNHDFSANIPGGLCGAAPR